MNATITLTDPTVIPESISVNDLVAAAGSNVARPRVVFEGNTFDGTKGHARTPIESIDAYRDAIYSEFEQVQIEEFFPGYTYAETAAALAAVLNRRDDGIPQPVSNDPTVKPSTKIVDVGYDWKTGNMRTIVVPAGEMSLPGFRYINIKEWQPTMRVVARPNGCFIIASIMRCDQDMANGVFHYVRKWANRNSIYLGQVIDANFDFVKLTDFKPQNVALTDTLRTKIELFVTGPLQYEHALDERGLPRKSGLFLWGPPGGGKTMAKTVCLYLAARMGAVVVDVDPSSGIGGFTSANDGTQRLLEAGHKVLIGMEDMEKLAAQDRAKVLDILDGTSSKGFRRITIGTTNFLEVIDRAMLRPGRFDAVEYCGLPDLSAFTQLVKVLIAEEDRGDIDFAEAFPHFEGYSYAFIANAVQTIIRSAINRAKGDLDKMQVNTQDLIDAAQSVRGHFDLMNEEVVKEEPVLDRVFRQYMHASVERYMEDNYVQAEDATDYDRIYEIVSERVDEIVEGRLDGADLRDPRDGETKFRIATN